MSKESWPVHIGSGNPEAHAWGEPLKSRKIQVQKTSVNNRKCSQGEPQEVPADATWAAVIGSGNPEA